MDFESVLRQAWQLTETDRLRLIDALWQTVPEESDLPLHEDWAPELERRVAAIQAGQADTVLWSQIRDEALARLGHGSRD